MSLVQYTFASHARRGFQAGPDAKATITVAVAGQADIVRHVDLMTAGDVTGIPAAQVIRSYPKPDVVNAEPNYLVHVEFDSPDIPWLFSRPGPDHKLQPWVCLAVMDESALSQGALKHTMVGTQVTAPVDELPDPDEAWLWSHVQLLGSDTVPADPSRSLARLVSPRRLAPEQRYLVCVVPTTEAARLAGLGNDPGDKRTSLDPAWRAGQGGDVTLPVYHWFRFRTGPSGDFEALVRRLKGVPIPDGLGRRRLRLDHSRSGMPAPAPAGIDLELHVALRPPDETLDPLLPLTGQSYIDTLQARLRDAGYDLSLVTGGPGVQPPEVGPPVWGQLPVGSSAVASALGGPAVPPWLSELNLDPRLRVAAGLGAEVVRRNQDHYVEQAWLQIGDVKEANRLRRRGEYSLAASLRLYSKWITQVDAGDLLTACGPVQAKIGLDPGETIVGRLRGSPLPPSVVSVEFRRFSRFRGQADPQVAFRSTANVEALRVHSAEPEPLLAMRGLDSIDTFEPPSVVWGAERAAQILTALVPGNQAPSAEAAAAQLDEISTLTPMAEIPRADVVERLIDANPVSADTLLTRAGFVRSTVAGPPHVHLPPLHAEPPVRGLRRRRVGWGVGVGGLRDVRDVRDVLDVHGVRDVRDARDAIEFHLSPPQSRHVVDSFRAAMVGIAERQVRGTDTAARPGRALAGGLEALRAPVVAALHPRRTITNAVNSRIAALLGDQAEHFDDIMAAPDLSEPTYDKLAEISHDWLLPGIDSLPPDRTTLVVANREFIASFLVGMNHELARELLWREYPTDQRGTYAREFWTHKITADRAARYDLRKLLHQAPTSGIRQLAGDGDDPLVLVVKGELVKRYPSMLVFAAHTKASAARRVFDETGSLEPDFLGLLAPDVLLVGFSSLTAKKVRDAADTGMPDDAWWFFFAEHFAEPRFGFDELVENGVELGPGEHRDWTGGGRAWNDAAWQYAGLDRGFLTAGSFADSLPKRAGQAGSYTWAGSAAEQAWITLQFPFRRGIPALDLLPPRQA